MVNVVLAGGGSAGHTSPLIATAEVLARQGDTLSCIGTPRGLENRVIPAAGLELDLVDPVPLPRKPSVELAKVPFRLAKSVKQARDILRHRQADVLVGFGGYVSLPGYLAARMAKIPIVIHEQNALPGLANKIAARFASRVAVTFPDTPLPGAEVVGLPIRGSLTALARAGRGDRQASRTGFGLHPDLPTVLVSGGSQGARSINQAVAGSVAGLLAQGIQVLHVLGPKNLTDDLVTITDPTTGAVYQPVAFVDAMEDAYAAADLMVGRSGAGTVCETAALGLPTILVPFPHGNGEQARNSVALVEKGGALIIADGDLTPERLGQAITELIGDPEQLATMAAVGPELMPADAAERLAAAIHAAAKQVATSKGASHGAA